uniref:Manganese-transporting ATPase 13A1 n=1 Tax=Phallusia mammillata TaxID=59560 RepID=A0A6F9D7R2_9ASCI|nr:manganese-transporting ATPase 13A1 [Phallusia mammillata]
MQVSPENDNLVRKIELYNKRHWLLYGFVIPFLLIYCAVAVCWYMFHDERFEVWIILSLVVFLVHILAVLFCFWSVDFRCFMMYTKVSVPLKADYAKVVPTLHNGSTELVLIQKRNLSKDKDKIWVEFQKMVYVFDAEEKKRFLPVEFPTNNMFKYYQNWKGYQDEESCEMSKEEFGDNVMEMIIPEFKELFLERATAPFFVFQVFCVVLWCLDEYWYYSLFTLFMLVAFEASLVYQQLRNMAEIRKMGNKPYNINVFRSRKWRHIPSNQLVAGDIISITRSSTEGSLAHSIPCDVLLLRGRVIVDEAMLTGESVPQMKEPIENVDPETVLDLPTHSRLHLISGGTKVVQHEPPTRSSTAKEGASRPPDNGCVGYVIHTGFNTSQGKLLRTILYGVKRVTANNLETFAFIMFLLVFAITASAYVWVVGSADPERSRYKLVLNCVLILTSVVPPELPIELSLAVNSSLLALSKLYVYCTEPFRIPFAGKADMCCFDKTGTLTSDSLIVEGIAGINGGTDDNKKVSSYSLCPVTEAPAETQKVLATCHALVNMEDDLVGDPLEQAMLKAVEWNLTKGDVVIPKKRSPGLQPLKVVQRFHFSSLLKRMSTIVSQEELGSVDLTYMVTVKGAAEALKPMFSNIPSFYDEQHQSLSQRGARVLALGYRMLGKGFSISQIRGMKRDDVERNLTFVGFVIISCPLKSDSKAVMKELRNASHHMTMITGDNPLTACHVGKVLHFTGKSGCLILTNKGSDEDGQWFWQSVDSKVELPLDTSNLKSLFTQNYDLCLTGNAMSYLQNFDEKYLKKILPSVRIFARTSPKQKEQVIISLKQLGFNVLMCGDGTNDVGALKHAHVGVALLSNPPESVLKKSQANGTESKTDIPKASSSSDKPDSGKSSAKGRQRQVKAVDKGQPRALRNRMQQKQDELARKQKKMQDLINEMEPDPQVVKMGDASIAAPFSYKLSSTAAICHIIKQGRCTLVTTLQMFKILALNALVLAYSQSVLYLDGVKFSDAQATLQGLLLAGCFLFISRSKPLKVLSKQRPLPNIFNAYTILTICGQFSLHFASLVYLVGQAKEREPREKVDFEADFKANLLNSTVYVLSLATQIITFAINYRGHPFMESLWENKPLLYSLVGAGSFLVALVTNALPEVNQQFEIVEFENEYRLILLQVIGSILLLSWTIDRSLRFVIGTGRLRRLH